MIKSLADRDTTNLWKEKISLKWKNLEKIALRKLSELNKAKTLFDLASSGNHLEALRGNLRGYYSIRINKQYRVIFIWEAGNAYEVSIVDYH